MAKAEAQDGPGHADESAFPEQFHGDADLDWSSGEVRRAEDVQQPANRYLAMVNSRWEQWQGYLAGSHWGVILPSLAILVLGLVEAHGSPTLRDEPRYVLIALSASAVLLGRRRYPELVLFGTLLFWLPALQADAYFNPTALGFFSALVAALSLGFHATPRSSLISAVCSLIFVLGYGFALAPDPSGTFLISCGIGAGWSVRVRDNRLRELEREKTMLEAERAEAVRLAVVEERVRIARELHDSVAHTVSVMTLQAGAARRRLSEDQREETAILQASEAAGRQAIGELRRMLGLLRSNDAARDRAPQPTLADLPDLVKQVAATGADLQLQIVGAPRAASSGLELSAYRIVQEALNNAAKHSARQPVVVRVEYTDDAVILEVANSGGPGGRTERDDHHQGHGLVGMRERAALFGGELVAAPQSDGGFLVRATLPTKER